ncbi:cyclic nucleotide-binding protein [Allostella vacuolata]|nr:cyclic nucleotide-binding protein [Stella vacuolata]
MEIAAGDLARADGFAYRTAVGQVMTAPLVTASPDCTLGDAARRMAGLGISALVVADPGPVGIVTERDLLRRVGDQGGAALALPLRRIMSTPLHTVRADALVATALGRMDRLAIRHLMVVDAAGQPAGMVSARALLRLRARDSLVVGDSIAAAADVEALRDARARVPLLAAALRRDGAPALDVVSAIAATVRESTARAAELAVAAMREAHGPAPAAWCLLVLGSGGRGESLLVPDQDNALIHAGCEDDDAWFAELGRRIADILDAAGLPYCQGGIMAREARWRHDRDGWRRTVDGWLRDKDGGALLDADIFFDFRPVAGDGELARGLRAEATAAAARSPLFLRLLADHVAGLRPPLGIFGRILAPSGGLDLKKAGTMPVVAAARTLALAAGSDAVGTPERLAAAVADGRMVDEDRAILLESFETVLGILLDRQLAAIAEGRQPGNRIVPSQLDRHRRAALRQALRSLAPLPEMVAGGIAR